MEELNEQQKKFADYYLETGKLSDSARRAGYSEKTAGATASRLLKNVKIQNYLKFRIEQADRNRIASADEVLETLTQILRRQEMESVVVTKKVRKSYFDSNGKKVIDDCEEVEVVQIPSKLSDVNKAAELLGRRYRIFTDKVDVNGIVPVVIAGDEKIED